MLILSFLPIWIFPSADCLTIISCGFHQGFLTESCFGVYSGYLQVLQEVLSESNKTAGLNALHLLFHPIFAQNMIYNICCKLLCAAVKPAGQLNCLNDLANQMKRSNSQQVRCPVTMRGKNPYVPDYVPSWQRRILFTIIASMKTP